MAVNNKSPHILNASSNLLGLCFVVLTSLKFLNLSQRTYIDETVTIALVFFMLSCILSFLSIRGNLKAGGRWEAIADYLFLSGMIVLFLTALLILFNVIA
jgi:surface polysaccharide O-acyltransferase-like enzyme